MNIWLLTTEFPPYYGGGIATYAQITTQLWTAHGHNVTVFVSDDSVSGLTVDTRDRVRVIRFPNTIDTRLESLGFMSRLSYNFALWTAHFIQKEGAPDILESQEYMGIAAHLLQRKKTLDPIFAKVPVVITAHNPKFILDPINRAPTYQFPEYWTGEMERFSLAAADGVISPSRYLQRALVSQMPQVSVEVIANPYDLPPLTQAPRQKKLLFVGRLQYFKGIAGLMAALVPLWNQGLDWPLEIVAGDSYYFPKGEMMKAYLSRRYAAQIKRGLVTFKPAVKPAELPLVYAQATAMIFPSLFDNLPYVALEAMAQECLVISLNTGGQQEMMADRESALVCNPDHLSETISEALALSPEERGRIGANARRQVARLTDPEMIYTQKMAYFERILAQKPSAAFPFVRPAVKGPEIQSASSDALSVVIPHYNLGPYLLDTLKSLDRVAKEHPLSIVVVDDGSSDGVSIAALHKAQKRFPQLTVLRTPNQGLARARNFGAQQVHTPYLAFLDADDMVDPRYYPRAIKILQSYGNVSFVGAWAQYFGSDHKIWPTWNPEPPYALYHNPLNTSALVYRRDHFLEFGMNDPEMEYGMEDYESMVRMLSHGCQGVSIPEPYFFYRVRQDSMSRAFTANSQRWLYRQIVAKNPDFYARYAEELLFLFNANGPQYLMDNPGWNTGMDDPRHI